MTTVIPLLILSVCALLAGCYSVQQAQSVQRPGEPANNRLQVPPNAGERPIQTAAAQTVIAR